MVFGMVPAPRSNAKAALPLEIGKGAPLSFGLGAPGSCAVAHEGGDAGHDQEESAGQEAEPGNVGDDLERSVLVVADDSCDGDER